MLAVALAASAFDTRTRQLARTYPTQGENLLAEHADSGVACDGHGSLLLTNHAFATMLPSQFTVLDVYRRWRSRCSRRPRAEDAEGG